MLDIKILVKVNDLSLKCKIDIIHFLLENYNKEIFASEVLINFTSVIM